MLFCYIAVCANCIFIKFATNFLLGMLRIFTTKVMELNSIVAKKKPISNVIGTIGELY